MMAPDVDSTMSTLKKFLNAFDATTAEVGVITLLVFLEIAKASESNPVALVDLEPRFNIPKSTVQRHVALLKDGYINRGKMYPGAKLLIEEKAPYDRRVTLLRLNAKGLRVLSELKAS